MTEKRFVDYFDKDHNYIIQDLVNGDEYQVGFVNCDEDVFLELINQLNDKNEKLKQDVEYWKQVASQYSNELNVFEHCKKHKTECKDIYWSSD